MGLVMKYSRLAVAMLSMLALVLTMNMIGKAQGGSDSSDFKTVIAEGVGASADRAKARDEAVLDAQRKAVEQGLGLYIKSETLVSNLELVSDTIDKQSSGFVHKYSVISENYNDQTQLYRVKIQAIVSLQRIETVADSLYDQLKMVGTPRIILLLNGTKTLSDPDGISNALTDALVEKGFKVLDDDQLTSVRQKDALRLLRAGDDTAKTVMLLQDKADIIIVGKVSAGTPERLMDDPATYSQRVTLDAKIIRVDTAEILGSKRGVGAGADFSTKGALESAEDKAGNDFIEKNSRTMLRAVLDPCKDYTVKIAGCSYSQLSAVDNKLALSRFCRQTDARFEDGYGIITVGFSGSAKLLAAHLQSADGIKLKVVSVTGVTVMVKPL